MIIALGTSVLADSIRPAPSRAMTALARPACRGTHAQDVAQGLGVRAVAATDTRVEIVGAVTSRIRWATSTVTRHLRAGRNSRAPTLWSPYNRGVPPS
jgi:hypothetical protein